MNGHRPDTVVRILGTALLANVVNHIELKVDPTNPHRVGASYPDERDQWVYDQLATLTDDQARDLRASVAMLTGLTAADRDRRRGEPISPGLIWTNDPEAAPDWARGMFPTTDEGVLVTDQTAPEGRNIPGSGNDRPTTDNPTHARPTTLEEAKETEEAAANAPGGYVPEQPIDCERNRKPEPVAPGTFDSDDDLDAELPDEPQRNPMLDQWPTAEQLDYATPADDEHPTDAEQEAAVGIVELEHRVTDSIRGVIRAALNNVSPDTVAKDDPEAFAEPEHVTAVIAEALETAYGDRPDILQRLLLHVITQIEFTAWRQKNDVMRLIGGGRVEGVTVVSGTIGDEQ